MIALMNTAGNAVAIHPDSIESVEQHPDSALRCIVRTNSGKEHVIERTYRYVTGILRAEADARTAEAEC